MVANEGLEKARAYLNQVPQNRWLYIPSEGTSGENTFRIHLLTFFLTELSRLLGEEILCSSFVV